MAYPNPDRRELMFPSGDAAAGDLVHNFRAPKAKAITLVDYGIQDTTVAFAAATSGLQARVGNATTADAYGKDLSLVGTAASDGRTVLSQSNDVQTNQQLIPNNGSIPPDTVVRLTITQGVGTPTGTGKPYLVLDIAW